MAYHRSLPACVYVREKERDFIDDGVCYKL